MAEQSKCFKTEIFKFSIVSLLLAVFIFMLYHFHLRTDGILKDTFDLTSENNTNSKNEGMKI